MLLLELHLALSSLQSFISSLAPLLLKLLGFGHCKCLLTNPFNFREFFFTLAFGSPFSFLLGELSCNLTIALLLPLTLFFLGKDSLELLDRATMLLGELLKLGTLLLLLLLLTSLLILLVFTQELSHELISLLGGVVEVGLVLLEDIHGTLVLNSASDDKRSVSCIIARKKINLCILHDVLDHICAITSAIFGGQMKDVVTGGLLENLMVDDIAHAKQGPDDLCTRLGAHNSELQWCESTDFRLHIALFILIVFVISLLRALGIKELRIDFFKQECEHVSLPMVASRTYYVANNLVAASSTQANRSAWC